VSRRRFDETVGTDPRSLRHLAGGLARQVQRAAPVPVRTARARTVAVVALDRLAPIGFVAELLERSIADVVPVARLANGVATDLEAAERAHDVVLLEVSADASEWRDFALRQADRVLLIAAATTDPDTLPPLTADIDVWLLGDGATRERLVAWHDHGVRSLRAMPLTLDGLGDAARLYADRLTRRSIGLVLSGGGARALAHLGVVEELLQAGVRIDRIAGCSMGAYIAALIAGGLGVDEVEDRIYAEFVRRNPAGDYTMPRVALTRGRRGHAMLHRSFGDTLIEELKLDYYTVATDLLRHELVVLRRGRVADAVGTSMALPGVSPPQLHDGRVLVDGGVLDNLPVGPMADLDEGPVIGVNVVDGSHRHGQPRIPGLQETVMRAMTMSSAARAAEARSRVALLITPKHRGVGLLEFHQYERMREEGRLAAQVALAEIGGIAGLCAPPPASVARTRSRAATRL
jgi:predicted acylesterase/phospholipase RssA